MISIVKRGSVGPQQQKGQKLRFHKTMLRIEYGVISVSDFQAKRLRECAKFWQHLKRG